MSLMSASGTLSILEIIATSLPCSCSTRAASASFSSSFLAAWKSMYVPYGGSDIQSILPVASS